MMSNIGKLKEELAALDQLIETYSRLLEEMLREQYGMQAARGLMYPASLNEMRSAKEDLLTLYEASSRLGEARWQREIKKEILRLLEEEVLSPSRASGE